MMKGQVSAAVSTVDSIDATIDSTRKELNATVTGDESLNGTITGEETLNATLETIEKEMSGSLTIHYGADGKPGKDGFSPTITVHEQTKNTYVLKITDVNGSYYTPNLMAGMVLPEDIGELLASKVDTDLAPYKEVNPVTLTVAQRDNSYLYLWRGDKNEGNKFQLSCVALKEEVDEQIRRKVQTVQDINTAKWEIGDYIFLEKLGEASD